MWTTDTKIQYPDGGPVPDTATYIQKLEREKQARESGEVKDNRSFFAKYVREIKILYQYFFSIFQVLQST